MKLFGFPMAYVVIAVGVLGVVVIASIQRPFDFEDEDPRECFRTYDFSKVNFTPEAKADWEKCYMPGPLYERRGNRVVCLDYPEASCTRCAETIALKYNNSNYCEIARPCVRSKSYLKNISSAKIELEIDILDCKKFLGGVLGSRFCLAFPFDANADFTEIVDRQNSIYPGRRERIRQMRAKYCN